MSVFGVILVGIFPAFSHIRTEYRQILRISPYSVRMPENAGKMLNRIAPNTDTFSAVEFINIVCIFILRLYWIRYFLIYFFRNFFCLIQCMVCLISLSKSSDVVPAFTCAIVIGNILNIWSVVNILSLSPYFVLYLDSDSILEETLLLLFLVFFLLSLLWFSFFLAICF